MALFEKKNSIFSERIFVHNYKHIYSKVPKGVFDKCPVCKEMIYYKDLGSFKICPKCSSAFFLTVQEYLILIADENTFKKIEGEAKFQKLIKSTDYPDRAVSLDDIIISGIVEIHGQELAILMVSYNYIFTDVGDIISDKMANFFEYAKSISLSVVVLYVYEKISIQENIKNSMWKIKIFNAMQRHLEAGLFCLAMLTISETSNAIIDLVVKSDVVLAEQQEDMDLQRCDDKQVTSIKSLCEANYLLENGLVDMIVKRTEMKDIISKIIHFHEKKNI